MASSLRPEDLQRLKSFIEACKESPEMLNIPQLRFFKDYLESLGANLPKEEPSMPPSEEMKQDEPPKEEEPTQMEEESEESEVELDKEGIIEPEDRDPPALGDSSKVVSEDDEMAAGEKRSEAMMALGNGELDKAVDLFTEAIKLNPSSAMLYAKRASILLKQNRVKAALRDCDEAIKLNPDSASAHKFRGRAHRLLGNWLEAAKDLRLACKLDFDEQANDWLKEVQPNATKLEEHQRKYERKQQEKVIQEKRERIRKAQEEAKAQSKKQSFSNSSEQDGGGMGGLGDFLNDPELVAAMQDPEVAQAFQDVSKNPTNIFKYQNNPKVSSVINKLMQKFGGGMPGGMPGSMPGGFPGAPGGAGFPEGMNFANGMPSGFPGFSPSGESGSSEPKNPGDDLD